MKGSGSLGRKLGPLPKHWSKTDSHMQRKPGLLKQMKKGASFSIPLHCLLSNSQNSAGHFIHRQASEIICTPWWMQTHAEKQIPSMHAQKRPKQTFLPYNNRYFLGGGLVCPGGMRAQRKPKPFGAIWYSEAPHNPKSDPKGERGCHGDQHPSVTSWLPTFPDLPSRVKRKTTLNAYIVPTKAQQTSQ